MTLGEGRKDEGEGRLEGKMLTFPSFLEVGGHLLKSDGSSTFRFE